MKKFNIIIILVLLVIAGYTQVSVNDALQQIEANNTTLQALQKRMEANQLSNKTGIYLNNPEVEFNYLFGSPSALGNRTDISVTQSFDFPTAYVYKKQLTNLKNDQLVLEYQHQKRAILLQAKQTLTKLTYLNALAQEYQKRTELAQSLAKAYQLKFEHGECSQLDVNKAQMNLLNAQSEQKQVQLKIEEEHSLIKTLNGGHSIQFSKSDFDEPVLTADFESWYQEAEAHSPLLQWLKQEVEINQKELQLSKAKLLPGLQAGYMSENVVGEQFQGITVGLSIPLWENKNTVMASRLNAEAAESSRADEQLRFYEKLKALHTKAMSLKLNLDEFQDKFERFNNLELQQKALSNGEISLIEFLYETTVTYSGIDQLMEQKYQLSECIVELTSYTNF